MQHNRQALLGLANEEEKDCDMELDEEYYCEAPEGAADILAAEDDLVDFLQSVFDRLNLQIYTSSDDDMMWRQNNVIITCTNLMYFHAAVNVKSGHWLCCDRFDQNISVTLKLAHHNESAEPRLAFVCDVCECLVHPKFVSIKSSIFSEDSSDDDAALADARGLI